MSRRAPRRAILPAAVGLLLLAAPAHAGNLAQGIVDVISGPLELPRQIVAGTFTGPPLLGTLAGVLTGVFSAVGTTLRGVGELASGAVSLGAAAAPYALPFLL